MKIRPNERECAMIAAIRDSAPSHWSDETINDVIQMFRKIYAQAERKDKKNDKRT